MSRKTRRVLAGASVVAGVGAITWWLLAPQGGSTQGFWTTLFGPGGKRISGPKGAPPFKKGKAVLQGRVLCPSEVGRIPPNTADLKKSDFVIVQLTSYDGAFDEATWAQVLSISPDGDKLYIQLVGEFTTQGLRPVATDKHKFFLGQKLVIERNCIFDILRGETNLKGQILCGPNLQAIKDVDGNSPFFPVSTTDVSNGDFVQIVVASPEAQGTVWHETLWVIVSEISPTKQILRGVVAEEPQLNEQHGLAQYSSVEFTRDCVIRTASPYATDFDPLSSFKYLLPPILW